MILIIYEVRLVFAHVLLFSKSEHNFRLIIPVYVQEKFIFCSKIENPHLNFINRHLFWI